MKTIILITKSNLIVADFNEFSLFLVVNLTGDHFGMRSSGLYCETHYSLVNGTEENDNHSSPHYFNGVGTGVKGRPRKQRKESQGPGMSNSYSNIF